MKQQTIFEVQMSPGFLKSAAAKSNVKVGIEYEMLAPSEYANIDASIMLETLSSFNDYTRCVSILKKVLASRPAIIIQSNQIYKKLLKEFNNYVDNFEFTEYEIKHFLSKNRDYIKFDVVELFRSTVKRMASVYRLTTDDVESLVNDYKLNQLSQSSVSQTIVRDIANEFKIKLSKQLDSVANEILNQKDQTYDAVVDYYKKNPSDDMESDFFSEIDRTFIEIVNDYGLNLNFKDISEQVFLKSAKSFYDETRLLPVVSSKYHGQKKSSNLYRFEPDDSISSSDDRFYGLEIVSPALDLDTSIDHYKKIVSWAEKEGCKTNSTTGLHINMSVPNFDQLDYVKLILLIGDTHILQKFKRESNETASSSVSFLRSRLHSKDFQGSALQVKQQLIKNLSLSAKKLFTEYFSDRKYFSVRFDQSGYIEFRSPGGNWLSKSPDEIFNVIYRFATVLSIACDPAAYREDYLKKLYSFISSVASVTTNPKLGSAFAAYAAGLVPVEDLANRVQLRITEQFAARLKSAKPVRVGVITPTTPKFFAVSKLVKNEMQVLSTFTIFAYSINRQKVESEFPRHSIVEISPSTVGEKMYRTAVEYYVRELKNA